MNRIHSIRSTAIRKLFAAFIVFSVTVLCGCRSAENKEASALNYRYASKEEGKSLLLGNEEYYNGFSQNDIDFKLQKNLITQVNPFGVCFFSKSFPSKSA